MWIDVYCDILWATLKCGLQYIPPRMKIVCDPCYTCHAPMIHPLPSPRLEVLLMNTILNPVEMM